MNIQIPLEIQNIYTKIKDSGFETYLVGGPVRDMLLKREVKDWDFTTNATPEEILKLFPDGFYDNQFGTVGVPIEIQDSRFKIQEEKGTGVAGVERISTTRSPQAEGAGRALTEGQLSPLWGKPLTGPLEKKVVVEITTFRTERDYRDGRHPTHVTWGKTLEEDLERRDFTVNAIAYDLSTNTLTDPFNGQGDLEEKTIKAVGDANKRFKEDALRLMRAIRFAAQLGFTIENSTWDAIREDAMLLPMISTERIRDELLKILASENPYEGIMMLKNASLLQYILPELMEGIKLSQSRPGRHHVYDVFTHNVLSLKLTPATDPIVRFATLIHDIGKSRVVGKDEKGLVIFYNHEIAGAKLAYEIADRLHFSKKDRKKIVNLIRWHMFTVDEHITDAAVRRFIRRVGVENVQDMIDLRIGDRLGSGIAEERAESWRLKKFKERIAKELAPAPFSINDLAIDGNDIMQELKIKPGPEIGKILQKLFEEVDEDLSKNTKEYLLRRLKTIDK